MTQLIYGIHPVQEALKSPYLQFQKILIGTQKSHPPLQSIIDQATKKEISRYAAFSPSFPLNAFFFRGRNPYGSLWQNFSEILDFPRR